MKLTELTLKNFRLHRNTTLDLSKPLTLIVGPNEQGKSTLQEALGYFFSGRARCTNERGVGAEDLISDGQDSLEVGLTWERDGLSFVGSRGRSRAGNHVLVREGEHEYRGEAANAALGDPDLMLALLDFGHFLGRDPRTQAKILQAALSIRAGVDECLTLARQLLESEDGRKVCTDPLVVLPLLQASLNRRLFGTTTLGPAQLAETYKASFEARKEKKATLDSLLRANPAPTSPQCSRERFLELQAQAEQAAVRNDQLQAEKGRLAARLEQHVQDVRRRDELTATITNLSPKKAAGTQRTLELAPGRPMAEILANLDVVRGERDRLRTTRPAAVDALEAEQAKARPAEDQIRSIEAGDTGCDGRYKPDACPIAAARAETAKKDLPALKRQLKALQPGIETRRAVLTDLDKEIAAADERVRGLEAEHRQAGQNFEGRVAQAQTELQQVQARLAESASVPADVQRNQQEISAHQEIQREAGRAFGDAEELDRQHLAYNQVREQVQELEALVAKLEATTWVLDPKRLPAALVELRSEEMLGKVNALLQRIFDRPVEIGLESTDDGVGIRVFDGRGWRRPRNMSSSALQRLGSGLSVVFAQTSGIGIACVDSADMLVGPVKDAALGALTTAGLEHLIIIATAQRETVRPSGPRHNTYWVEGGQAELVTAPQMETVSA